MSETIAGEPVSPESGSKVRARRESLIVGAGLAIVLLAAIVPRLFTLPLLFGRGELMQWDGDSAYHLKRILYALAHFPALPRFDPAMNWPGGAPCPWPDGFDLLAAGWGLVAGLGNGERATMAVVGFTTILGLLVIWSAMDLARLVMPEGPAGPGAVLAAGMLTAIVPSHVYQTQVGFLDHHVAELLAFLLLAGWALRRLPRPGPPQPASWIRWEIGGALAATFALWVFAGGVLYVAMAFAIVLAGVLGEERPRFIGSGLVGLATAAGLVALLTVPALRAHGRILSYQFPSLLQPLLVAGAAATLGLAVATARGVRGFARRSAVLAAIVVALAAVAALVVPSALHELRAGLEGWLLRRDPWIASVAEFQPFGWNSPNFLVALFESYGAIGVGAPLLLLAGGWAVVRAAGRRGAALVVLSAAFVALSLRQVRFERIGQPLLMIFAAATLAAFAHRKQASNLLAVRIFPVLGTLVLIGADPMLRGALHPSWARIPPDAAAAIALRDAAGHSGNEAVFTSWDLGHIVSVLSGLATPTNGFGSYLDAATFAESEEMFGRDESALDAYLARRRIRYVIAGALTTELTPMVGPRQFHRVVENAGAVLNLEYMKSRALSPLIIGGSGIPGADVRQIGRLMPIFGTREQPAGVAFPLPVLWVYERVPGARVIGRAAPGKRVVATLDFREQGRPHVWKAYADSDAWGRFELLLPFPTGVVRPALSSASRYSLRVDDGPAGEVEVPETVVRGGGTIQAGELQAGPGPRPDRPVGAATGSRKVKTAPPPSPLATETSPPKDSAIP
jgi:dolichyl-diphosphooligosaccharide--protein glycosyltransferase